MTDYVADKPVNMEGLCGAKTRSGAPCRRYARPNGKCKLHGGASTGPRTAEGLERMRQAKITHGNRTAEARQFRALLRQLKAEAKRVIEVG